MRLIVPGGEVYRLLIVGLMLFLLPTTTAATASYSYQHPIPSVIPASPKGEIIMSLNKGQFEELIRSVLTQLSTEFGKNVLSESAVNLQLGTAAQESKFGTYLVQMGGGPAIGFFQMEPATLDDIWDNYLVYKPELAAAVTKVTGVSYADPWQLRVNIAYQIVMARVHYLRIKYPLPSANDVPGLAAYWKAHYNTPLGRGTVEEFEHNYKRFVLS